MKRFFSILMMLALLAGCLCPAVFADTAVQTSDPAQALDEFLNLPVWHVDEEEGSETKGETIYPEEFAGMYVDEDGVLTVCVTDDSPEIQDYYRGILPLIPELRFQKVDINYNTLQHYMLVIEQRHVSSNLLVVTMYKIKEFHINYPENRIDIKMYSDLEYDSVNYLHDIFGDGIYIYFTDTTGEVDKYDEAYVVEQFSAQAEEEAAQAEAGEDTFSAELNQKAEESGFNAKNVLLPVAVVVVAIALVFAFSKLRSRKTDFSDDDYIDK